MESELHIRDGFIVTEAIEGAIKFVPSYTLMHGDLMLKQRDGRWNKVCPGISFLNIELTPEQEATLKPVKYRWDGGLTFQIVEEDNHGTS